MDVECKNIKNFEEIREELLEVLQALDAHPIRKYVSDFV